MSKVFKFIKSKYVSINLLKIIIIFLLLNNVDPSYAIQNKWIKVGSSEYGEQYWDKESYKKTEEGHIILKTLYEVNLKKTSNKPIEHLYDMEIDCKRCLFKDINRDGMKITNAEWESAKDDLLIKATIKTACLYKED